MHRPFKRMRKIALQTALRLSQTCLRRTAATAQAQYDLQAVIGAEAIARGDLATVLGLPPETQIQVVNIDNIPSPPDLMQSVDQDIDRSFQQRPDLKEQIARFRAAEAGIKEARSAYFPSLGFSGTGGTQRQNGAAGSVATGVYQR